MMLYAFLHEEPLTTALLLLIKLYDKKQSYSIQTNEHDYDIVTKEGTETLTGRHVLARDIL